MKTLKNATIEELVKELAKRYGVSLEYFVNNITEFSKNW
jgi:ABC-type uncharacterized transport system involved in gliding motility auxiliary subunit